jgi:hypothetical protein
MKSFEGVSSNVLNTFPTTTAKNSSTGVSVDGTPLLADYLTDHWALLQGMMHRAGTVAMTPSGTVEAYTAVGAGTSGGQGYIIGNPAMQHLQSLMSHFGMPGEIVAHFLNTTTQALVRQLTLTGQVVDGFLYPDLVYATWVGAGSNPTAPAFYTTSDSGGTTRATTGLTVNGVTSGRYLKLPDLRGYSLRGVDTGNLRDPAGSTRGLGSAQLDAFQGHWHSWIFESFAAGGGATNVFRQSITTPSSAGDRVQAPSTDGVNGTPRTAIETRMVNVNCFFSIRY